MIFDQCFKISTFYLPKLIYLYELLFQLFVMVAKTLEKIQYFSKELALGLNPISMLCAILSLRNFLQNAWHKYQTSLLVATTSWIQILPLGF